MKKYILVLASLFAMSCTTMTTRENHPDDIRRATVVIDNFYKEVGKKNYHQAASLAGGDLKPEDMESVLLKIDSIWGGVQEYTVTWAKTTVTEKDGKISGDWQLTYDVTYNKSDKNEDLFFLKLINDSLVITEYHSKQILF